MIFDAMSEVFQKRKAKEMYSYINVERYRYIFILYMTMLPCLITE